MRKLFRTVLLASTMALVFSACKKEVKETDAPQEEVSESVKAQIKTLGFDNRDVQKIDEGYLVEGDIVLTSENLASVPTTPELIIGNEEHYRTNNLVNPGSYPTIRVAISSSSSSHTAVFTAALDEAIRRYNAEGLRVRFQRVTSSPHITINAYYQVSNTLGSAGFPTSSGAPYSKIQMNTYWYNTSTSSTNVNYIATIMAHEMGHCIGFRHTDYMNRSYSCGGSVVNEGSSGVGAVHIPGTPTGPSSRSWMLACSDGSNRPFTSADRTALNYVY
ncbi:MAG TPA: M57 family metalloprotease [Flavipsychrobacter sp.]|nr:M57 family metalloprotease [Flavipsychrobacter sp.]